MVAREKGRGVMTVLLRYALLLGLGFASLFAFISAGSMTGQMVLASGEEAAVPRSGR